MAVRRGYKYMMAGSRLDTFFKWNIGDIDVPGLHSSIWNAKIIKHFSGMRKKFDRQIKIAIWNMSIGKCVQLCFFVMCAPLDDRFSYFCMCLGEITLRLVRFALFLSRKINTHLTHTHTHTTHTYRIIISIYYSFQHILYYCFIVSKSLTLKIYVTYIGICVP